MRGERLHLGKARLEMTGGRLVAFVTDLNGIEGVQNVELRQL